MTLRRRGSAETAAVRNSRAVALTDAALRVNWMADVTGTGGTGYRATTLWCSGAETWVKEQSTIWLMA